MSFKIGDRLIELKGYLSQRAGIVVGFGICNSMSAVLMRWDSGYTSYANPELLEHCIDGEQMELPLIWEEVDG